MPFTVTIPKIDGPPAKTPALVADRRLYLTADEQTLVEAGDERARFLLSPAGGAIPGPEVDRLGLVVIDDRVVQPKVECVDGAPLTRDADGTIHGEPMDLNEEARADLPPLESASPDDPNAEGTAAAPPDELKSELPDENKLRQPGEQKSQGKKK
jgi:hypothetical protein